MWTELKKDPLTVVHVNGLILFAKNWSARKKFLRFCQWKWPRRDTPAWYEIDESEIATEDEPSIQPILSLNTFVRDSKQLRLFNIFTQQDYTIPFGQIYEELRFLGFDSPDYMSSRRG